jgi:hypothetical protein
MMRTVWLGLICLVILGAMASLRLTMWAPGRADTLPAQTTTATSLKQDTLGKADKLLVSYTEEVPEKKMVTSIAIVPPKAASKPQEKITKIISRHWHEAYAKRDTPRDASKTKRHE